MVEWREGADRARDVCPACASWEDEVGEETECGRHKVLHAARRELGLLQTDFRANEKVPRAKLRLK